MLLDYPSALTLNLTVTLTLLPFYHYPHAYPYPSTLTLTLLTSPIALLPFHPSTLLALYTGPSTFNLPPLPFYP